MLDPSPNPGEALARYESVLLDMASHLLLLDDVVRRLPTATDSVIIERDTEWARALSESLLDATRQVLQFEFEFAVLRNAMSVDQIVRLQRCAKLQGLLSRRWGQIQSDLLDAAPSNA